MQILIISDIHANYPALEAIDNYFRSTSFDHIINCGDSVVYAPFPNETITWLRKRKAISILGNTDKKVIKLLQGKTFKKPSKPEKRCMYTWTADVLSNKSKDYLLSLPKKASLALQHQAIQDYEPTKVGIYHGSPARNHEFLFASTPDKRFAELTQVCTDNIVLCGHSHDPFHKVVEQTHFINPGSAGRMFDDNPQGSCAVVQFTPAGLQVNHHRISYDVAKTVHGLRLAGLPKIYGEMYRLGRKTN